MRDFSRASSELQVIARNCDWFIALSATVVIGRSNCFDFGFSIVVRKPLYAIWWYVFVRWNLVSNELIRDSSRDLKWRDNPRNVSFVILFFAVVNIYPGHVAAILDSKRDWTALLITRKIEVKVDLCHYLTVGRYYREARNRDHSPSWAILMPVLTLFIREFKQPRRLRYIKRHITINICAMVTISQLLLFARILYCWHITLKMNL